jgi:glutamine amidotransferase
VTERNALRIQSIEHRDGWGIAHYDEGGQPRVERGLGPALGNPTFEGLSRQLRARTVVAHLRLASVGAVEMCNVHPFIRKPWVFAHNGTLQNFEHHRAQLEEQVHPDLRAGYTSRTDSERAFFLFLTQLGCNSRPTAREAALALARTLADISKVTDQHNQRSGMNFLLTNGELLLATRREKTLFFAARTEREDSGWPPEPGERLDELVIASEQLWLNQPWHTVGPDELVGVDADMTFQRWPLATLL